MNCKVKAATIPPGPGLPKLRKDGARLLALDGGGVKGISAVVILDAIMKKVAEVEGKDLDRPRKPCDYFDLAGGTSTGGLIALMLFRLKMTTAECKNAYEDLAKHIFAPTVFGNKFLGSALNFVGLKGLALASNAFWQGAQFSGTPLEDAIKQVCAKYPLRDDDGNLIPNPWKHTLVNPQAKMMFMCATLKEEGESILLRSYIRPKDAKPMTGAFARDDDKVNGIDIVSAARATSAAPGYLPEETWKVGGKKMVFWDGGVLNNNPVEQVFKVRYDLVDQDDAPPAVKCMISIGCGWTKNSKPPFLLRILNTAARFTESFLANSEAKHRDFYRLVNRMRGRDDENRDIEYQRFNVNTGKERFDMADFRIMGRLVGMTEEYLGREKTREEVRRCAEWLAR